MFLSFAHYTAVGSDILNHTTVHNILKCSLIEGMNGQKRKMNVHWFELLVF